MKCRFDGCSNFEIPNKNGYCFKHSIYTTKTTTGYEDRKVKYPWQGLYFTNRWKALRQMHLSKEPLCVECGYEGNEVDHVADHKGNERLFYDANNLQTLCTSCHSKKTFADAEFYKLPKSEIRVTLNLTTTKECDVEKFKRALSIDKDTDYMYSLMIKEELVFNFSKISYIIKLYKKLARAIKQKPIVISNSQYVLDSLNGV